MTDCTTHAMAIRPMKITHSLILKTLYDGISKLETAVRGLTVNI